MERAILRNGLFLFLACSFFYLHCKDLKMTKEDVLQLLEANKNERGIKAWERMGGPAGGSFGLGLTQMKKLAKQVGKDHALAQELWEIPIYDAKTMAILVDEPKVVRREQVEAQIAHLQNWMLTHTYGSMLLAKVKFQPDLMEEWLDEENDIKRRCAWIMVGNLAKSKKLNPERAMALLEKAANELQGEENFVRDCMNNALLAMGSMNAELHEKAMQVALAIGPVVVDYGDNACQALDVVKHLSSPRIKSKVGIQ